jgi:hypothetical protein
VCFIDIEEKKYKTMILGDHRQKKKRKKKQTGPVGLRHQHGLPLSYTHRPVRVGHQHGQALLTKRRSRRETSTGTSTRTALMLVLKTLKWSTTDRGSDG